MTSLATRFLFFSSGFLFLAVNLERLYVRLMLSENHARPPRQRVLEDMCL